MSEETTTGKKKSSKWRCDNCEFGPDDEVASSLEDGIMDEIWCQAAVSIADGREGAFVAPVRCDHECRHLETFLQKIAA